MRATVLEFLEQRDVDLYHRSSLQPFSVDQMQPMFLPSFDHGFWSMDYVHTRKIHYFSVLRIELRNSPGIKDRREIY